jgi:hypothetical protein
VIAIGAGEAAAHVAEERRFEQRIRNAGAVDRDERRQARRLLRWMSLAITSFPTPLSPVMSTFESERAANSISSSMVEWPG